ncbi:hypothetical protein, partial [Limnospira sp. Paracas R14]|uniref:hypothetical protein n=1 Tax=Limnospira sp. Paracas R14 TaxID=2981108 RepID=UPI0028E15879|nr:hypothetical protein [Limnospira sp. Paracas R14]
FPLKLPSIPEVHDSIGVSVSLSGYRHGITIILKISRQIWFCQLLLETPSKNHSIPHSISDTFKDSSWR